MCLFSIFYSIKTFSRRWIIYIYSQTNSCRRTCLFNRFLFFYLFSNFWSFYFTAWWMVNSNKLRFRFINFNRCFWKYCKFTSYKILSTSRGFTYNTTKIFVTCFCNNFWILSFWWNSDYLYSIRSGFNCNFFCYNIC